jgi:hypothetical protein
MLAVKHLLKPGAAAKRALAALAVSVGGSGQAGANVSEDENQGVFDLRHHGNDRYHDY